MFRLSQHQCPALAFLVTIIAVSLVAPGHSYGAFLYKSYVVRQDGAQDVLCDPYLVQENDYVLKIFRQKGEISRQDFDEFLSIFRRINPHIQDINIIRPGEHIFIPLKKLKPNSLPGQATGVVTIPFVTISGLPEILESHSTTHEVRNGDTVSILVARKYGAYGTASYEQGMKLFRQLNPNIVDVNRIYKGQTVYIPNPTLQNEPWYESLFDSSGNLKTDAEEDASLAGEIAETPSAHPAGPPTVHEDEPASPVARAASILGASLLNKGIYYFPGKGDQDFAVDLSAYPVLNFKDGTRMLFSRDNMIRASDQEVIKSFWHGIKFAPIPTGASVEQILDSVIASLAKNVAPNRLSFADRGVEVKVRARWVTEKTSPDGFTKSLDCITLIKNQSERTSSPIRRYLEQKEIIIKDILKDEKVAREVSPTLSYKIPDEEVITLNPSDRKSMVSDLVTALGYPYEQNIPITFPYAGIQLRVICNLVSKPDGRKLLVDFGDLHGDALTGIAKSGIDIIQLGKADIVEVTIRKLLDGLGVPYSNDPTFFAAKRPDVYNTSLTIPGFFVTDPGKSKALLTHVTLHYEVIQFLIEDGIKIILLG